MRCKDTLTSHLDIGPELLHIFVPLEWFVAVWVLPLVLGNVLVSCHCSTCINTASVLLIIVLVSTLSISCSDCNICPLKLIPLNICR